MTILNNQYYKCQFYKRIPNEFEEKEKGITFKAQLVSDKEKTRLQKLNGMFAPNTRIVLKTSSPLIYEFKDGQEVHGYVEFQGDIYQVESIRYDITTMNSLNNRVFSKEHTGKNAIKVLSLI